MNMWINYAECMGKTHIQRMMQHFAYYNCRIKEMQALKGRKGNESKSSQNVWNG